VFWIEIRAIRVIRGYKNSSRNSEQALKEAYMQMGYWNYSAKMPSPPVQQAAWAPDGQRIATTCTRFTGMGSAYETDLCLVKVPEGTFDRIPGVAPHAMEWTGAGRPPGGLCRQRRALDARPAAGGAPTVRTFSLPRRS
jgi:hypothetical protein